MYTNARIFTLTLVKNPRDRTGVAHGGPRRSCYNVTRGVLVTTNWWYNVFLLVLLHARLPASSRNLDHHGYHNQKNVD